MPAIHCDCEYTWALSSKIHTAEKIPLSWSFTIEVGKLACIFVTCIYGVYNLGFVLACRMYI